MNVFIYVNVKFILLSQINSLLVMFLMCLFSPRGSINYYHYCHYHYHSNICYIMLVQIFKVEFDLRET